MRKLFYIFLFLPVFSCNKDTTTSHNSPLLKEIRTANGVYHSFEYQGSKLAKENLYFGMCSTPVDEYTYSYQDGKLDKMETTMRSLYSSTLTMCNPAAGIKSTEQYEYDNRGRLSKVIRQPTYTVFEYNTNDLVIKQTLYETGGTASIMATFKYDVRGNIIEETNYQGITTNYEYDNKINPFYSMNRTQGWISAFNTSPNNVIKANSGTGGGFERKITRYQGNLPVTIEENGVTYTYVYH